MWWILQTVLFSIFFIAIIHYLYLFFMNNLTTPIVKDLVHTPSNKYQHMFHIINNSNANMNSNMVQSDSNSTPINDLKYDLSDLIPNGNNNNNNNIPPNNMKDELKSFLQEQLND